MSEEEKNRKLIDFHYNEFEKRITDLEERIDKMSLYETKVREIFDYGLKQLAEDKINPRIGKLEHDIDLDNDCFRRDIDFHTKEISELKKGCHEAIHRTIINREVLKDSLQLIKEDLHYISTYCKGNVWDMDIDKLEIFIKKLEGEKELAREEVET